MGDTSHFEALEWLLKAPSKEAVINLCNVAFTHRDNADPPVAVVGSTAATFSLEIGEAKQLLAGLARFIKDAMFLSSSEPQDVLTLFPENFRKNLRDLLTKIVLQNQASWRAALLKSQVSLPHLLDFGWHIRVNSLAEKGVKVSAPSCVLELQIRDTSGDPGSNSVLNQHKSVQMELTKETLDTMLDGLGKIRDQLSSVASRS